jgi:predicted nucleic acid-binding protein
MIILDTDHISVLQHEDSSTALALLERLESLPSEEIATTVATLEESAFGLRRRISKSLRSRW